MDDKIIPFGKHKGKPIEVLASDKQYMDWLLAQTWFKDNHVNLYNVVINNFREDFDTPEHNKIQIKFLQQKQRLSLAYLVNPNLFLETSDSINNAMLTILERTDKRENEYFLKALQNPNKEDKFGLYHKSLLRFSNPIFEKIDVAFHIFQGLSFTYDNSSYGGLSHFHHQTVTSCYVEIKPTISDDFPAVLRQMKISMPISADHRLNNKHFILLVGSYTGKSATEKEFIEFFETQGYKVIFEYQLENIQFPKFDTELILCDKIKNQLQ